MTHVIEKNGKYYLIETGYGFNVERSSVTEYDGVDRFGRFCNGRCVFIGTWDECLSFVENLEGGVND